MTATLDDRQTQARPLRESRFDSSLSIFSTVALILLLYGFCWLKNNLSFTPPQIFTVAFHEVAGLSSNAGVYVDGVRVGIVDKIELVDTRKVLVRIRINSDSVVIPVGSKVSILTNGVVGAKYVEITMPPNSKTLAPASSNVIIEGEDPVRPELAVNNLAIALSEIDFPNVRKNLEEDHDRIVLMSDQLTSLMRRTAPLIERAVPLEEKAIVLADRLNRVSEKMSKLLDNPNVSSDIRETATQLRETMVHVRTVMDNLNRTLKDEDLRKDIDSTMDKLNQATASVQQSMEIVQNISDDKGLRNDMKVMLRDARDAMTKVDKIVTDPAFGSDLRDTLVKSQSAIENLDLAAQRMNQMLDKRSPLLHMLIGRPGKLSKEKQKKNKHHSIMDMLKEKPAENEKKVEPAASSAPAASNVPASSSVRTGSSLPSAGDNATAISGTEH